MKLDELKNKKVVVTNLDGQDVVLVSLGEKIQALSAVCTHRGCLVEYNAGGQSLDCPCHGSVFDLAGNPTEGPAKAPLPRLNVKIDGDEIKLA